MRLFLRLRKIGPQTVEFYSDAIDYRHQAVFPEALITGLFHAADEIRVEVEGEVEMRSFRILAFEPPPKFPECLCDDFH